MQIKRSVKRKCKLFIIVVEIVKIEDADYKE